MKTHTLMAHTPPGISPPYFNASCRGGIVTVTVRNVCGQSTAMDMELSTWCKLVDESRAKAREAGTDL